MSVRFWRLINLVGFAMFCIVAATRLSAAYDNGATPNATPGVIAAPLTHPLSGANFSELLGFEQIVNTSWRLPMIRQIHTIDRHRHEPPGIFQAVMSFSE